MVEKRLTIAQALKLAVEKHNQGKLSDAEIIYRQILNEYPNTPDALHLLGVIYHQKGHSEEAIEKISKAIQLKPSVAIYYGNLAMAYDALGDEEESTKNFEKALALNPKYEKAHLAHYNLGIYYKDRGRVEKALEHYNKTIKLDKTFFDANWNRGLLLLLLGRFKEGWRDYEYRFRKKSSVDSRNFSKPKWSGGLLEGKRILIVSEQGFGDNIQFIRYLPLIKEKGGYVILECKKEFRRLFEDFIEGVDEFADFRREAVPNVDFDCYIHLMSLPGVFNTDLNNIPSKFPYLKVNSELVSKFKEKLDVGKFKIGISWAGNPNQANDKNRSTTFERFKILKKIPGIKLFSLQKGEASKQLDDLDVVDLSNEIHDFADTAAVIENMDLIISVDTALAHLAGAMQKPVWVLLSFIPDWRYLLNRKDNLWYPSMRLFRQPEFGNWNFVFDEVSKELGKIV